MRVRWRSSEGEAQMRDYLVERAWKDRRCGSTLWIMGASFTSSRDGEHGARGRFMGCGVARKVQCLLKS